MLSARASLATSSNPQSIAHNLSTADTLTYEAGQLKEVAARQPRGWRVEGSVVQAIGSIRLCPFVRPRPA